MDAILTGIYNFQMRHPCCFEYNVKISIVDKIVVMVAIQKSCFGVSGVLVPAVYSSKLGTVLTE